MRRWLVVWLIIVVRAIWASAQGLIGKPAPTFTAKTLGGKAVRLADLRGKVVLLHFWSPR